MKNILMIATGGTIASKEGDLGLTPAVTGEELAKKSVIWKCFSL